MAPGIRRYLSHSPARLALAIGLAWLTGILPGWAKGLAWFGVFLLGAWAFLALVRDLRRALKFLEPHFGRTWRVLGAWSRKRKSLWRALEGLCLAALVIAIIAKAWPVWNFMGKTSLREDEIMNVATYTSQGFVPAVSTYSLARNHIFFNVLNAFLPWADSTFPLRARLISFLAVLAALAVLLGYAWRRGWLLAGAVCAGLLAVNADLLKVILEARGYGLITLFALIQCLAFTEWLRTKHSAWLGLLAFCCVVGTYTLPFYVVFGGTFLLLAFLGKPSRATLGAGLLTLAAIVLLYLPVLGAFWKVSSKYKDAYEGQLGANFSTGEAILRTLEFFIPRDAVGTDEFLVLALITILVLFAGLPRPGRTPDRRAVAGILVTLLVFLGFCFLQKSPPIRIAAFTAAPLAFLVMMVLGSALASRGLAVFRPLPQLALAGAGLAMIWKTEPSDTLIPQQNWRGLGRVIDRAFPEDERIWVAGRYHRLLEWNLRPRREVESGDPDLAALAEGRLIAVEGFFKIGDAGRRLKPETLPAGVRFVTLPLLVNYHRVFFVPPSGAGIKAIIANGHAMAGHEEGRQPYDPGTLGRARGHGDVLYSDDDWRTGQAAVPSNENLLARPAEIPLPGTLEISLEDGLPAGSCNLLFTQTLEDKILRAQVCDSSGKWSEADVLCAGELASVALPEEKCRAVRVGIAADPDYRALVQPPEKVARPAFGLLEAWTCR